MFLKLYMPAFPTGPTVFVCLFVVVVVVVIIIVVVFWGGRAEGKGQ